jgi:UDP-glucose 4-epimerase
MRKKIILVTGGSGFIGSEVVYQLVEKGWHVRVVDILKPQYDLKNVEYIKKDLRNSADFEALFKNVSICIHLAAHIGNISYGVTNQSQMLKDNLLMDLYTIDAAARSSVEQFINISSSLVYEQSKKFPVIEKDVLNLPPPFLSYSFEKLISEKLAATFAKDYSFNYTICRLFNAYGLNSFNHEDKHKHVIAHILEKMLSGQYPLEIYGKGEQKRNFTHVKDLARGIVATAGNPKAYNNDFNIGNPEEYSVLGIIDILWELIYKDKKVKLKHLKGFPEDVSRNYPDIRKSKKILGWEPQISMEEGIKELVDYKLE